MRLLANYMIAAMLSLAILIVAYIIYLIAERFEAAGVHLYMPALRPVLGALVVYVVALFVAVFVYIRRR